MLVLASEDMGSVVVTTSGLFDGAVCYSVATYGPTKKACEEEELVPGSVTTNGWSGATAESSCSPSIASFPLNLKW